MGRLHLQLTLHRRELEVVAARFVHDIADCVDELMLRIVERLGEQIDDGRLGIAGVKVEIASELSGIDAAGNRELIAILQRDGRRAHHTTRSDLVAEYLQLRARAGGVAVETLE